MENIEIWEQVLWNLRENKEYMHVVRQLRDLEPDYLNTLDLLTDLQRDRVERYMKACDAQMEDMVFQAYRLGYEKGKRDGLVVIYPHS